MPSAVSSLAENPSCWSILELLAFKSAYPTGVSLRSCQHRKSCTEGLRSCLLENEEAHGGQVGARLSLPSKMLRLQIGKKVFVRVSEKFAKITCGLVPFISPTSSPIILRLQVQRFRPDFPNHHSAKLCVAMEGLFFNVNGG